MKTAVVTGAAGFIGSHVARAFEASGYVVRIAGGGMHSDPLTPERIGTLGTGIDVVLHCAGGSSVAASFERPHEDFARSVPPFANILEHLRTFSPAARVVLLSSAAVYGAALDVPTPETCATAPVSPYGVHKRMCEELCMSYGRSFGIASVVVRLFSVYGPGLRKQLLWDACTKARAGEPTFGGTGDEERDWLHIDDAVSLILAAAERATSDVPVINGGSGRGVRVSDVVGRICRELGAPLPRFSGEARPGDPVRYIANIDKARSIGWTPKIDLARGIAQYVAWFREQR